MKKGYIFIILTFALVLLLVSGQQGCELPEPETECQLSLCDCKCYPKGQTPEELQGVLCGIDCYGLHNISGCEYVDGTCQVVYGNKSEQENSLSGLETTGSAQDNPEPNPTSKPCCGL